MATTDTMWVLTPFNCSPPATLAATFDIVQDASTPLGNIHVLDFDTTTAEFMDWFITVPSHYDGGGFTCSMKCGTDHATDVGTFEIELLFNVIADASILTDDLGFDTGTAVAITDTPPSTPTNKLNYSATQTLTHANAGSPAVGNYMNIRAKRDTATDTNLGDLQLAEILILET